MKALLFACAVGATMAGGCAHKNSKPSATTRPAMMSDATTRPSGGGGGSSSGTVAAAPAVPSDKLAGAFSLAVPRRGMRDAKITFTDPTHVTIEAGENLSGDYVVQGSYLLILTRDEGLRPLAWRINSPDSLTVVRSPATGDFTGATLVRAAATASADTEDDEANAGGDFVDE